MSYDLRTPSNIVHDDLMITAIAIECGNTKAILMSVAVCFNW